VHVLYYIKINKSKDKKFFLKFFKLFLFIGLENMLNINLWLPFFINKILKKDIMSLKNILCIYFVDFISTIICDVLINILLDEVINIEKLKKIKAIINKNKKHIVIRCYYLLFNVICYIFLIKQFNLDFEFIKYLTNYNEEFWFVFTLIFHIISSDEKSCIVLNDMDLIINEI
jgi:hypothetical protein